MPLSVEVLGKGVQLKRGNAASPEVFTAIEKIVEVPEAPDVIRDLVEKTNHDSPGTNKEYMLGLGEGNEITFLANWLATTQQQGLLTDKTNGTERNFELSFPQFSPDLVCSFTAVVRAWDPIPNINGPLQLRFTLKITGAVSWA